VTDTAVRLLVGAHPRRTLLRVVGLVGGAALLFGVVLLPVRGEGPSMAPTIADGEFLLVSRQAFRWRAPRRGDVVAVALAGRRAVYVKRIVGLPGERLAFRRGQLFVDGVPQDEPYAASRRPWSSEEVQLGGDQYFVVGDNRGMAMEDHALGAVRRDRLIGPVIW
jgi:signal peptidase I